MPNEGLDLQIKPIEQEKLKLERQRLAIEVRIKRREQQFQRQQLESKQNNQAAWTQIFTPVGAAIIAALVGFLGTVWNGYQNNRIEKTKQIATERLERQKLEASLILDAIKTAGTGTEKEQHTAANLLFLSDAGFITIPEKKLKVIRDKAGDLLPSLPESGSAIVPTADIPIPAKHYKAAKDRKITSVVVHSTESPATTAGLDNIVRFINTTDRPVSAHYFIGVDGKVAKVLDESYVAFHVGRSKDERFKNSNSIGIELVGYSKDGFTERQVNALEDLLVKIVNRHKIDVNNIVGHKDIPGSFNSDPGPKLDLNTIRERIRYRSE